MANERQLQHEIRQTVPFRSLGQEALVAIYRTAGVLARRYDEALQPFGITLQQYNVLRILRGAKGRLRTLDIGERMIQQTPGITRLVDRLVDKGLVARERCKDDRRVVYCSITAGGLELLAGTDSLINGLDDRISAGATEQELETTVSVLERIRLQK